MPLFVPKDRRSLFRQFLAGMYDAVVITDPNGHIIEVNPRTVEYFGYEFDEVLDQPVSMFIPGLKQDVVLRIRKGLEGDRHVVIRNVERRRAYMNAFRAKASAFQVAQTALFACDADGRICEANDAFLEMFGLESLEDARKHVFSDFMDDDPMPANFRKALAGEKTVTGIVAEGDGEDREEVEIVLAPNLHGHKVHGVVGSLLQKD